MAQSSVVQAAGAELYTERVGDGPALLLISGGGGDADMYEAVAPLLAERFMVLTYDRRGNSRSRFTGGERDISTASQASDAVAVLDHYGVASAYVFGSSGGAIIALDLLARHPGRITGLVAHEPPLMSILPDDSVERRQLAAVHNIAKRSPLRAYAAFGEMILPNPPWLFRSRSGQAVIAAATGVGLTAGAAVRRLAHRKPGSMTRQLTNAELALRHELPAIAFEYQVDEATLARVAAPWRLAVGQLSEGKPYYRPALLLSQRLGAPCEIFPGGHTPYVQEPEAFVGTLQSALESLTR